MSYEISQKRCFKGSRQKSSSGNILISRNFFSTKIIFICKYFDFTNFLQGGKSKCLVCDEMFWTDALFRQHWKKCVAKWVKTAKHEQENSALKEQLIHQLEVQQPNSIMVSTKADDDDFDEENNKQNNESAIKDPLVSHQASVISGSSPEKKVIGE